MMEVLWVLLEDILGSKMQNIQQAGFSNGHPL